MYLDRIVHRMPHAMYFTVILNVCFIHLCLDLEPGKCASREHLQNGLYRKTHD